MRILSVIVASPLRKITGATNAGRDLSIATAPLVDLELMVMWDKDERVSVGPLDIHYMRSTNRLGPLAELMPRFVRVPLYDSAIPERILTQRYDLVHMHNLVPGFAAERVARACLKSGTPYIISTHGFVELSQFAKISGFGPLKSALADFAITQPFHRIVKGATGLFALSDCEMPLLASLGVPPEKVQVVTNGVNEYYMDAPTEAELADVRAKFLRGPDPVLLFMGSLHPYKGVDTFLASLAGVRGPFQAIIAGRLKGEEEKRRLIANSGLSEELVSRLSFTGGLTDAELRALYHSAAMLVYPTRGDTLPLVILEAMACRRPVISTRIGGIPFAVTSQTGLLVEPSDANAVSEAVNSLLSDPGRRVAMGQAGRLRVEQVFQWSKAAEVAVQGYAKILAPRRAGLREPVVAMA